MHLMGMRYYQNVYGGKATFASYGVTDDMNREQMLSQMPEHHKDFFRNLEWVVNLERDAGIRVVCVHAGWDSNRPLAEQLEYFKRRDFLHYRPDHLCGREDVLDAVPRDYDEVSNASSTERMHEIKRTYF